MPDDYLARVAGAIFAAMPAQDRIVYTATVTSVSPVTIAVGDEPIAVVGCSGSFKLAMQSGDVVGAVVVVLSLDGQPWILDVTYGGE